MKTALITLIGLFVLLGPTGVCEGDSDSSRQDILAVVNHDTIYISDMDKMFMSVHRGMDNSRKESFDYRSLLNKIINDRLIVQEAGALGIDQEEWLLDKLEGARTNNAIRQFAAEQFKPDLEVSDKDVEDYFHKYYSKLQIRTISATDRNQAEELITAIKSGAAMDSIAGAASMDMYRYQGGLHNLKSFGDVENELREQAVKLKPGEISPPFPYRKVFAFLRVEQAVPADTSELDSRRKKIVSVLKQTKYEAEWAAFLDRQEAQHPYSTDSTVLMRVVNDSASLFSPDFTNGSEDAVLQGGNDFSFSESQLRTSISRLAMERGTMPFDSILTVGLSAARQEFLLMIAAYDNGYFTHPEVEAKYAASLDSSLIEIYLKETVVSQIRFNQAEFKEYYDGNPDKFREPDELELDQLEIADKEIAMEIERRLKEGADFDFIAKEYGSTGKVERLEIKRMSLMSFPDQVGAELDGLKIGESSRAFPISTGFIVFHVHDRHQGRLKEMNEVEMEIREVMFQRKFDELLDQTLVIIKANSTIEYNDPAIEKYFGEGL